METNVPLDPQALRELLLFYAEAGADEALDERPEDRFVEALRTPAPSQSTPDGRTGATAERKFPRLGETAERVQRAPVVAPAAAAVPDEAQAARARELARSAASLDELHEILKSFDGCNLRLTAKSMVFADGNPQADLMLVGEAPGREEDREGLPFVGRSGQLLDRILLAIGRDRRSAYISNVIPWRPPGNRDPSPLETEICRPFIERHIELAKPKILVTLGNPSTKLLLGTQTGIMRMRGTWSVHTTPGGTEIPTMPTLHPAYLLRNPAHKRLAWRDWLAIKARLAESAA